MRIYQRNLFKCWHTHFITCRKWGLESINKSQSKQSVLKNSHAATRLFYTYSKHVNKGKTTKAFKSLSVNVSRKKV